MKKLLASNWLLEMGRKVCPSNWLLEVGRKACPAAITITTNGIVSWDARFGGKLWSLIFRFFSRTFDTMYSNGKQCKDTELGVGTLNPTTS